MTKFTTVLILALLAVGCGPVTSVHPLYTKSTSVWEPALVGTWVEDSEDGNWTFRKSGEDAFELIRTEEGQEISRFEVHLVKLGEFLFLDASTQGETISAHFLGRLWMKDDVMRISLRDEDWLKEAISQKKVAIACERLDGDDSLGDQLVLTASTEDLQKLVVTYAANDKTFPEVTELHRQK